MWLRVTQLELTFPVFVERIAKNVSVVLELLHIHFSEMFPSLVKVQSTLWAKLSDSFPIVYNPLYFTLLLVVHICFGLKCLLLENSQKKQPLFVILSFSLKQ